MQYKVADVVFALGNGMHKLWSKIAVLFELAIAAEGKIAMLLAVGSGLQNFI